MPAPDDVLSAADHERGQPPVVVLVEGRSDVAALSALIRAAGIVEIDRLRLIDMGGVTNIRRNLEVYTATGRASRILGLCDANEERVFARALAIHGVPAQSRADMAGYGFQVCDADLEDELIRTLGTARVLDILAELDLAHGFQRFGQQVAWRDADLSAQLHRFAGIASGRKVRVAGALATALAWPQVQPPLRDLVAQIASALRSTEEGPALQRFPDSVYT